MEKNTKQDKNSMPNSHLHELLVDEMKDMLNAERQLLKGLMKLSKASQNEDLRAAFEKHHEETETHIEKLKEAFEHLQIPARGKKCKAMEGLIKEAEEIESDFEGSEASDAALISAAQKIEHYEIASYGCMATYAELMQHDEVAQILREILDQEKMTDELLTDIAKKSANKGELVM
ncbi:ferritin-like domain-containing protein [Sphingobacterium sp. SGG-5]|uniref:YciE/YciF ferroxidase family protein n=1 Tax=Sphingobacterium sp. SGG-5 TaxID=2710881 RepID=UPI0013EC6CA4|nr:ferritin-like domain-containing protein [Sphingobacterium sp. SGG-5]NGM61713.1 ferritin-like domain-containing protein [Sphingobacterium sp. SGG-5]